MHGDEAPFDVHGDYLFGAPMAGAKVRWTVTRGVGVVHAAGRRRFVVDDTRLPAGPARVDAPRGEHFQNGDGALDAHGVFSPRVPLALAGQSGPES